MDIKVYNTLTRQKELFAPIKKGAVSLYHCGPTVYWNQHLGNMRAVCIADIVHRTFVYNGYTVTFVRNYTDVGHLTGDNIGDADTGIDRMEKAAVREQRSPEEIADKYIAIYKRDIALLHTLPATHTPRATEHIDDIIAMIQTLLQKEIAYQTPLAIYFDTTKAIDYNRLSGQKAESLETGAGTGDVHDSAKRNAQDFALWFFRAGTHAHALQYWASPFHSPLVPSGEGFPGWHIECSAMSKHFLGNTFDIHMGGIEHIPVHHTNEIAQSESANGAPYVRYWIHNEHLLVDGKKMAKSEGTSYILSDIIEKGYDPLVLRYFFLQAHYSAKQNFTFDALEASRHAYTKLIDTLSAWYSTYGTGIVESSYKEKFLVAINDDFNTAKALACVYDMMKDAQVAKENIVSSVFDFDTVLGCDIKRKVIEAAEYTTAIPPSIRELSTEREAARARKDWAESDRIRESIESSGYKVYDTKEGARIEKI